MNQNNQSIADRLFVLLLQILPHHLLSRLMLWLTRWQWAPFKNWFIRKFIRLFRVDMSQAKEQNPENFSCFNDFFTRELTEDARPICEKGKLASPADGAISAFGDINHDSIIQAKGMDYSLLDLVGGDKEMAELFNDGSFATIYLSPRDYHRVHMPLAGQLTRMHHVPGRLFSVNNATARTLPRLFTRNERVVCLFDTDNGPMAMILVGAIFVGAMDTVWAGTITPADLRVTSWDYSDRETRVKLDKGEEMGRFNMGSTVILLYPKGNVEWEESLMDGTVVRMGKPLGTIK